VKAQCGLGIADGGPGECVYRQVKRRARRGVAGVRARPKGEPRIRGDDIGDARAARMSVGEGTERGDGEGVGAPDLYGRERRAVQVIGGPFEVQVRRFARRRYKDTTLRSSTLRPLTSAAGQ
jgi:hypothetical protein